MKQAGADAMLPALTNVTTEEQQGKHRAIDQNRYEHYSFIHLGCLAVFNPACCLRSPEWQVYSG